MTVCYLHCKGSRRVEIKNKNVLIYMLCAWLLNTLFLQFKNNHILKNLLISPLGRFSTFFIISLTLCVHMHIISALLLSTCVLFLIANNLTWGGSFCSTFSLSFSYYKIILFLCMSTSCRHSFQYFQHSL